MQGMTRDNAIATGLFRPGKKSHPTTPVPDRDDPGDITSAEGRQRDVEERASGNESAANEEENVRLF